MEIVEFKRNLGKVMDELSLPDTISPRAFQNAAIVAFSDNPQIASCTPQSVFQSVRRLAGLGLVPDGIEAALVPFRTKQKNGGYQTVCQAMPMVAGLIKRARNSGEVSSIWAEVVYENEELTLWNEDGYRRWRHDFNPMARGGDIVGAYAVARLKDGTIEFEAMPMADIQKIRNVSRAKDGPAWRDWFNEMAKKSVIRRLIKRLPISSEDRRDIVTSDEDTIGLPEIKDITPRPSLQERIEADGFPGSSEWSEGMKAFEQGRLLQDNPYEGQQAVDWAGGWNEVDKNSRGSEGAGMPTEAADDLQLEPGDDGSGAHQRRDTGDRAEAL